MGMRAVLVLIAALGLGGQGISTWAQATTSPGSMSPSSQEVSGRIEDSHGAPASAAMVELQAWNGGLLGSQITGVTGDFDFHVNGAGPFALQITWAGETKSVSLDDTSLDNIEVRMGGDAPRPPTATAATVSLNDLEAPGKAKSKLAGAEKAINKFDLGTAWKLANEAIEAAPNWGRAYLVRGVLSMENRDYNSARADLGKALARDPRDAATLTQLGKLNAATGHLQDSDADLRAALKISPVLWPTYFELANLDMKRGNYQEAEQMASYAEFATPPAPPSAHYLTGEAAYKLHDWTTAAIEFRSFLALAPESPDTHRALVAARQRLAQIPAHQ